MKKRLLPFCVFLFIISNLLSQVAWEPQAEGLLPSNYSVMNLSIVNDSVVWAVALDFNQWYPVPNDHLLKVMRTANGGDTWTVKDFNTAPGRMTFGIVALDDSTALLSVWNSSNAMEIFKTTTSGDIWNLVDDGAAAGGRLMFFNDTVGVSVSIGYGIARTTDGGDTWELLEEGTDYPPFDSEDHLNAPTNWDIVGDNLWIGTTKGRLYKSTDKGLSWDVNQAANENESFVSTAFIDGDNGLSLVGDFNNPPLKLLRSNNGGADWDPINNDDNLSEVLTIPTTGSIIGVSFFDSLTTWSTDLGTSWDTLDSSDLWPWAPAFSSPETGWITNVRENGSAPHIYKWIGPILPVQETMVSAIELSPNPATDYIRLQLPETVNNPCEISLFDSQGRIVKQQQVLSGQMIEVAHLPSGFYTLKMMDGERIFIGKFIKQ